MDSDERERELAAAVRQLSSAVQGTDRDVAELRAVLDTVIEILVGKEVLSAGHKRLLRELRERANGSPGRSICLRPLVDKYTIANADIDCDSLRHLCHSRCCAFSVRLTTQDVEEGKVRWEIDQPYMLRHHDDGYCAHYDRATSGCLIYEHRPAACREFECSQDQRVWIDFENQQAAPMPAGLLPPRAK